MRLFEQGKLERILIEILSEQPRLSAERLGTLTARAARRFSQAAVYKELSKLQARGVVVKDGVFFSLSLAWILDVFSFSDRLTSTYFTESYLQTLLPDMGQRQRWRFTNLVQCNDFWNQLLLALLRYTKTPHVLSWVPHPWFLLLSSEQETRLQRAFTVSRRRFYTIFGSDPAQRALIRRFYASRSQEYSFAPPARSGLGNEQIYLDIVGDYVLTVRLDPTTSGRIAEFFAESEVSMGRLFEGFRGLLGRCQVAIRLEYNASLANRYRRLFAEHFGVSLRTKG
jgi:hypothetical protein